MAHYYGGINVTDMLAIMSEGHSAFSKDKNGKIWCNLSIWTNDAPDQFGNSAAALLNSTKDRAAIEGKKYIGNFKLSKPKEPVPLSGGDIVNAQNQFSKALKDEPTDDLPF